MRNWLSENGHRDLRFILEEASEALGPNTKLPKATARWRLTGAASLIETLRLGQQNLYAGPDAIDNFPELVRHLIQLAIPATGLPTEVVADDSWRALELLNADALDTSLLLHVPPEPLRPISPSTPLITREDHDILAECLKSHNDWLFVLAAHWLSEEPTDDQLAILWDALPHLTAPDRFALGCWLLAETQKKNDYHRFLYGNDSVLRLASARIIGEMGTKETLINALVENPNLTLRLEVLQGLTKGKHLDQLHGYAQLAISKEPAEWTCKSCGSVEPVAQWDCANCTSGSRRHLHEEVQKLFKKTFLED